MQALTTLVARPTAPSGSANSTLQAPQSPSRTPFFGAFAPFDLAQVLQQGHVAVEVGETPFLLPQKEAQLAAVPPPPQLPL